MPYVRALGADSVTGSAPPSTGLPSTLFSPGSAVTGSGGTTSTAAKPTTSGGGGFWDTLKNALMGGVTAYGTALGQKGQAQQPVVVQQGSSMPSWLPYVMVGGLGLVVLAVVKSRK